MIASTTSCLTERVTLVAEEVDALAGQLGGKLKAIEAELEDVQPAQGDSNCLAPNLTGLESLLAVAGWFAAQNAIAT